jgi:hypothetical protein
MFARCAWFLTILTTAVLAEEGTPLVTSQSQDESMGLAVFYDEGGNMTKVKLVSLPSQDELADVTGRFAQGVYVEWAPDSSMVAVNGRAGERHETCVIYKQTEEGLGELPAPEQAVAEVLARAMEAARKQNKAPEIVSQRKIWDKFAVRKWIDEDTIELMVHSARRDYPRDAEGKTSNEEGSEVSVSLICTLKLNADQNWDVLETREVGKSEVLGD